MNNASNAHISDEMMIEIAKRFESLVDIQFYDLPKYGCEEERLINLYHQIKAFSVTRHGKNGNYYEYLICPDNSKTGKMTAFNFN